MSGVHRGGAATNKNGVRNRPLESGSGLQYRQQVRVLARKALKVNMSWVDRLLLAGPSIALAWLITHASHSITYDNRSVVVATTTSVRGQGSVTPV